MAARVEDEHPRQGPDDDDGYPHEGDGGGVPAEGLPSAQGIHRTADLAGNRDRQEVGQQEEKRTDQVARGEAAAVVPQKTQDRPGRFGLAFAQRLEVVLSFHLSIQPTPRPTYSPGCTLRPEFTGRAVRWSCGESEDNMQPNIRNLAVATAVLAFATGILTAPRTVAEQFTPVAGKIVAEPEAKIAKAPSLYERLDRGLNRILASAVPEETALTLGYRVRDARIQVVVEPQTGRDRTIKHWLEEHDAAHVESAIGLVQAHVPFALLPLLDDHPDVRLVRRPLYVHLPEDPPAAAEKTNTLATTEGLGAMGMDAWHSQGLRGAGIKVGVIDPQMGRWDQLLGSELPPGNRVSFQSFSGSPPDDDSVHGTACAEIVTDLAPDMDHLYLALTGTEVGIANAINWMQDNGVKVITMSAGWLSWGPGDGSGALDGAVDSFVNSGGVWCNSAGNSRLAHWQGRFVDPDNSGHHNFDSDWEINYITDGQGNPLEIRAGLYDLGGDGLE